jgi:hypothetical protein
MHRITQQSIGARVHHDALAFNEFDEYRFNAKEPT